ncbi:MAG: TIM44-like domain-containing protein, partial [Deltaproteobacteria bacterium]|nr:TIM44-like domain-containing protein [Deltaproteobacteria bacterium]
VIVALCGALCGLALARPGGGDSYSGGGGHGGGGGDGDGDGAVAIFELLYWLVRLTIEVPQVGLPLIGIVLGWVAFSAYKKHQNKDWDSGPPVGLKRQITLEELRALDPDFSQLVFEDFVFRLFATAHRARRSPESLATVAPYVSAAARTALASRPPVGQAVESVVIGAMRTYQVLVPEDPTTGRVQIGIEFEANVTTAQQTYFTVESWLFARDATRTSKPPGATRGFPCPNCGAPWQATATGTQVCASCGEVVDNGRFDWIVETITLRSTDTRPPTLTTEVPERGTDLPTYRAPDADDRWLELQQSDPTLTEAAFGARLDMIYRELHRAWAANELAPARGLLSDGLFDYLQYWIDAYRAQGLRNHLVDMRILHTTYAKLARDRWYDAITVRIWATGHDYVVREADGEIVRGSQRRERKYSEYWTLIRAASRKGAPIASPSCSNCGAPLQISMTGACEHCGAHVTAGEFDWVLSKIEQDDSYRD